jgi:hypothetical protein
VALSLLQVGSEEQVGHGKDPTVWIHLIQISLQCTSRILKPRLIAVGPMVDYQLQPNGCVLVSRSCARIPLSRGYAVKNTNGQPEIHQLAPIQVLKTLGREPRLPCKPNLASMGYMTWEAMYGSGPPMQKAIYAGLLADLGGIRQSK